MICISKGIEAYQTEGKTQLTQKYQRDFAAFIVTWWYLLAIFQNSMKVSPSKTIQLKQSPNFYTWSFVATAILKLKIITTGVNL